MEHMIFLMNDKKFVTHNALVTESGFTEEEVKTLLAELCNSKDTGVECLDDLQDIHIADDVKAIVRSVLVQGSDKRLEYFILNECGVREVSELMHIDPSNILKQFNR